MKKILSLILCMLMLLSSVCTTAFADDTYEFFETRQAINRYNAGAPAEFVVPSEIGGIVVESILESAFRDNAAAVEKLTLPESLMLIGNRNFNKSAALAEVVLPETLQVVGSEVFRESAALTEITIPASVTMIGKSSFAKNENLKSVTFTGMAPLFVGKSAFGSNHPEMVIYVPDDQIDAYIAVLPEGLNIQPSGANAIAVDYTASEDAFTFDAATGTITATTNRSPRLDIPATIGGVPVTAIGAGVFKESIYAYCIIVPEGVTTIGDEAFASCTFLDYVDLPDSVTTIGVKAFNGYQGLVFEFPAQLQTIGEKAFAYSNIDVVALPEGLTEIPASAFERAKFSSLTLPGNLTAIGEKAFYQCKYYNEVTIPASVTSIGSMAFAEADRLEKVTIECDPAIIPEDAFNACKKIKTIIVPSNTDSAVIDALAAATGATIELSDKPYVPAETPVETPVDAPVASAEGGTAGVWNAFRAEADGMMMDKAALESYGLLIKLTLNEDGTGSLEMEGEAGEISWSESDGAVEIAVDGDSLTMTINADGTLAGDFGDVIIVFAKEGSEPPVETPSNTSAAAVSGTAEDFIGAWNCTLMNVEGVLLNPVDIGLNMVLVINGDGTCSLDDGEGPAEASWAMTADGGIEIEGMILMLNTEGKLVMSEEGAEMYFERGEAPVETPVDAPVASGAGVAGTWVNENGVLVLNEDGTGEYTSNMTGGVTTKTWEATDTGCTFSDMWWNGSIGVLEDENTLNIDDGWNVFKREGWTEGSAAADILGEWTDGYGQNLLFTEDGKCMVNGEIEWNWEEANGVIAMTWGNYKGEIVTVDAEGALHIGDYRTYYRPNAEVPDNGSDAVDGEVVPVFAAAEDFAGVWSGLSMEVDGQVYALSDFDMTIEISMGADGLITLYDGESTQSGEWTLVDGTADIDGMILYLMSDGTVIGEDEEGTKILFTYLGGPAKEPVENPVETPVDLSASPVVGVWNDGEGTVLTINADGTCVATDLYGDNNMEWNIVDGVPMITTGWWSEAPLVLNGDGTLYVSDGFVVDRIFMPGEGTAAPTEPENNIAVVAGTAEDFVGFWNASVMEMEGMTIDVAEMGMVMDLTINADGTITMFDGESAEEGIWTLTDGKVDIMGEMQLALTEDGRLCMEEDGAAMYFVRGDGAEVPVVPLVGEAEDFVGLWVGYSTEVEGQSHLLSDLGVTIEIKLDADGVITLYDGEAMETGAWTLLEDGTADIDGMILTLMSDGTVIGEDPDGMKIVFNGFVGTWKACYMSMGDLRALNLSSTLILNADGTGSIDFPTPEEGNWYREEGVVRFGENGMPMEILTGGFLKFGSDLGGYLVFSRDEEAVWDPSMAIPVLAPVATPAATQAPANGEEDGLQARMNRKYVAKTYTTTYGDTRDASEVGEYAIIFRENGTCDFTVSGITLPNLSWGLQKVAIGLTEVEAFVINYYGTAFNAVITDEGFDMDYYGSMTLHFVPEK